MWQVCTIEWRETCERGACLTVQFGFGELVHCAVVLETRCHSTHSCCQNFGNTATAILQQRPSPTATLECKISSRKEFLVPSQHGRGRRDSLQELISGYDPQQLGIELGCQMSLIDSFSWLRIVLKNDQRALFTVTGMRIQHIHFHSYLGYSLSAWMFSFS